ncbi:RpiB/LacA/LacB family sugar-phosphate isomerase, partial [Frankia sp. AgW1.1]|uniref:RpiB/LacA/LacB family sugar-phosphate isomerase n=1 Tax=Frankia sp. AgW1.1 TaxID=1836971 RepID=UPI0027DD9E8A
MRVHLGSDHAGYHLKAALVERLAELGHTPVDHGPSDYDPDDDYPPFVMAAAAAVAGLLPARYAARHWRRALDALGVRRLDSASLVEVLAGLRRPPPPGRGDPPRPAPRPPP